jgi:hypothetical protein
MPHLICFFIKFFGFDAIKNKKFVCEKEQNWTLDQIKETKYGKIYPDGTYDVDDHADIYYDMGYDVYLIAGWAENNDDQSINIHFKDGTSYKWNFGLCPADAYVRMIEMGSKINNYEIDRYIHNVLDKFDL